MRNATIVTIIDQNEHTFNAAYLVDGCSFTSTGETFEATETDQVVFLVVNGGQLTLTDSQILKSGDANTSSSSGDNIPPLKLLSKNHLKGPKNDPPPAPPGGGDDDYKA
ncbi:hypothetical protein TRFO_30711 [Tritrichomonas foetus]|uniref:Uncharacterized protein n=1 Tax=Tritrichomonas foetus TaxID=1144522 RepID=A0A1J4JU52_9EUKA|nr:hypothetical protein TRFO_30711 [Tritrichomonas foetus]|eukprot:OHT02242.1 hypothetical protein TRFO_30711 [Tritrichomonas foetus]